MKKIYVFSLWGIIYAIDEDGEYKMSSVTYGFTQRPKDFQVNFLIEGFKEFTEKFKSSYTIVIILSKSHKEELSLAIKKLIDFEKINRPDLGDVEYWEKAQISLENNSFDIYNKDIWQKIIPEPSM